MDIGHESRVTREHEGTQDGQETTETRKLYVMSKKTILVGDKVEKWTR